MSGTYGHSLSGSLAKKDSTGLFCFSFFLFNKVVFYAAFYFYSSLWFSINSRKDISRSITTGGSLALTTFLESS
jgi:hypothetical protein